MSKPSFEFDHPDQFFADAEGRPGQRVFYLQVHQDGQAVGFKSEKGQVAALAEHLAELLRDLPPAEPEPEPTVVQPAELVWAIGALGLAYDRDDDRIVLIAQELGDGDLDDEAEGVEVDVEEPALPGIDLEGEAAIVRILLTRPQAAGFVAHARDVVGAGRATCPICGRPMDPEGHVCPRSNGHRPAPPN